MSESRYLRRDEALLRMERAAEQAARPPRQQPSRRQCLRCRRMFKSEWCGNRLCEACVRPPKRGRV